MQFLLNRIFCFAAMTNSTKSLLFSILGLLFIVCYSNSGQLKKRDIQVNASVSLKDDSGRDIDYRVNLVEKTLKFKELPKEFHNFKIGLITDIHIGYFKKHHMDKIYNAFFKKKCNKGRPPVDVMVFLGDLVNYDLTEMDDEREKWLKKLKKCSKYNLLLSILGNHDYDSYNCFIYKDPQKCYDKKMAYFQRKTLGWDLIKNSHIILKKGNSKIKFAGIEHLGRKSTIPFRGSINKAITRLSKAYDISDIAIKKIPLNKARKMDKKNTFPIMLAHDPSMRDILWYRHNFPLIFSGHTHGSSILLDGIKQDWSLDAFFCRNPFPAGLYTSKCSNKFLYVSKGVGLSGVNLFKKEIILYKERNRASRIPEVVIITLKKC